MQVSQTTSPIATTLATHGRVQVTNGLDASAAFDAVGASRGLILAIEHPFNAGPKNAVMPADRTAAAEGWLTLSAKLDQLPLAPGQGRIDAVPYWADDAQSQLTPDAEAMLSTHIIE